MENAFKRFSSSTPFWSQRFENRDSLWERLSVGEVVHWKATVFVIVTIVCLEHLLKGVCRAVEPILIMVEIVLGVQFICGGGDDAVTVGMPFDG